MATVFFSYRSTDRALAGQIIEALEQAGFTIWFDRQLHTGEDYRLQIQRELETSDLVIALWTQDSVRSAWVINEADAANSRGALISIVFGKARIPERFRWTVACTIRDRLSGPTRGEYLAINKAVRDGFDTVESQLISSRASRRRSLARLIDYGGTALAPAILVLYFVFGTNVFNNPAAPRISLPDWCALAAGVVIVFSAPIYFFGRTFEYMARAIGWMNAGNSRLRITALWIGEFLSLASIIVSIWVFKTKSAKLVFEKGFFAEWDLVAIGMALCISLSALITLPKFLPFILSPRMRRALLS
jgi:hypothetical protein